MAARSGPSVLGSALGLALLALVPGASLADAPRPEAVERALEQLSTLHVMRGLQLSVEQVRALSDLALAAHHLRKSWTLTEAPRWERLVESVDRYVDGLLDGRARDGLADADALAAYQASGEDRARSNEWVARMRDLEDQARRVIGPERTRIVEGFTRCVVSPGYLADPERIGEAGKRSEALDRLHEVRSMDAAAWQGRRTGWIEEWLRGIESEVGPLGKERRGELAEEASVGLDRVRRLDRLGFRIDGPTLAAFFDFEEQERRHHRQLANERDRLQGGPSAVARWLLSDLARDLYPRIERSLARRVELPDLGELAIQTCKVGARCASGTILVPEMARP